MKRGQLFTKLSMAITLAVKQSGGNGDPETNFKLRLAIEAGRNANMPKENIERAIAKASGGASGDLQENTYEGYGPGGFSVIVDTLTDNRQRTVSEVKNVFDKNGGNLGTPGSVMYQFTLDGVLTVAKKGKSVDDIFLIAADGGAEDIEDAGDEVYIYTKSDDLAKVRKHLLSEELSVTNAELIRKPKIVNQISEKENAVKALSFIEKLESLSDVQEVYANFDIPESILREIV